MLSIDNAADYLFDHLKRRFSGQVRSSHCKAEIEYEAGLHIPYAHRHTACDDGHLVESSDI